MGDFGAFLVDFGGFWHRDLVRPGAGISYPRSLSPRPGLQEVKEDHCARRLLSMSQRKTEIEHMQIYPKDEEHMGMALTRGIYETTFLAALDAGKSIEYTDRDGANFFRVFRGHHHRRSNTKKIAPSRSVYPRLS